MTNSPVRAKDRGSYSFILRLAVFGVVSFFLLLDIGLAGIYVRSLTSPLCNAQPEQISGWERVERVWLAVSDGSQVPAWYYPSSNGGAVITLGGPGGALGTSLPPAEPLLNAGYGVLQVGSRACALPAMPVTLGYTEAEDALAGLAFLQSQAEIKAGGVGIFGYSMGGVAAIRAAARSNEFAAVVAEGGYHNLGEDIVEPGAKKSLPETLFLYTVAAVFRLLTGVNPWMSSPIDDLAAISPRPVMLIFGEGELAQSRALSQFENASQPKSLWIVPGGMHGTNYAKLPEEYSARVLDFFNANLLSGSGRD